jgi:hypothetical protein
MPLVEELKPMTYKVGWLALSIAIAGTAVLALDLLGSSMVRAGLSLATEATGVCSVHPIAV